MSFGSWTIQSKKSIVAEPGQDPPWSDLLNRIAKSTHMAPFNLMLSDIKEDPKESFELWGNEGYVHAWVMSPVSEILSNLQASMSKYPNIKPGEDFGWYK